MTSFILLLRCFLYTFFIFVRCKRFCAFLHLWNLFVKRKNKKFKTGLMTSFIVLLLVCNFAQNVLHSYFSTTYRAFQENLFQETIFIDCFQKLFYKICHDKPFIINLYLRVYILIFVAVNKNSHTEVFCKKGVLRNFVSGLQLYQKRNSGTGVFLWILLNFLEHLLLQNTSGGCIKVNC